MQVYFAVRWQVNHAGKSAERKYSLLANALSANRKADCKVSAADLPDCGQRDEVEMRRSEAGPWVRTAGDAGSPGRWRTGRIPVRKAAPCDCGNPQNRRAFRPSRPRCRGQRKMRRDPAAAAGLAALASGRCRVAGRRSSRRPCGSARFAPYDQGLKPLARAPACPDR